MVNEDEHSEVEMRCRIQQGANARGKVEGFMLDRNILKNLKRKVYFFYLVPQYTYVNRPKYHLDVNYQREAALV